MTIDESSGHRSRSALIGSLCMTAGVVALAMSVFVGVTSFTAFDPPGWVRIVGVFLLLASLVASVGLGVPGLRGAGRTRSIVGLILGAVAFAACVVMIVVGG